MELEAECVNDDLQEMLDVISEVLRVVWRVVLVLQGRVEEKEC